MFGLIAIPLVIATGAGLAADNTGPKPGDVIQSVGPAVPSNPHLAPLALTDQQRQAIRDAVAGEDTEITFQLKSTKGAQAFAPTVGAKVPAALKLQALPQPLIHSMPVLKQYSYIKLKDEVAIVDPMTRKVAAVFMQ
jgi:hypothetical protein